MNLSDDGKLKITQKGRLLGLSDDEINLALETADEEIMEGRPEMQSILSAYTTSSCSGFDSAKAEFNQLMLSPETSFWLKSALSSGVGLDRRKTLEEARLLLRILTDLDKQGAANV